MDMFGATRCLIGIVTLVSAGWAHAGGWDEATLGDLSNNGLATTVVPVSAGSNVVSGTMGNAGTGVDRDYFTITVPPGHKLAAITLLPNSFVSGSVSFVAVQVGPAVTTSPAGAGVLDLLGFNHYGPELVGTDVLPVIVSASAGNGLPAGTYSFWIQETGGVVSYELDFVIAATGETDIPTLPEWGVILLGTVLLGISWRAQRN